MTESADPIVSAEPRRGFLKKALAVVIGGVVSLTPVVAGVFVFLDPLRRMRRQKSSPSRGTGGGGDGAARFIEVAPLSALPADGIPRRFQVLAARVDAWNVHPASPIGAVFLKRTKDDPRRVVAFNVICPHLSCSVEIAAGGSFRCPCHNSNFHPDGSLAPGSVSPRGLDELETEIAAAAEAAQGEVIRVRFQNFQSGTHEKIPTV